MPKLRTTRSELRSYFVEWLETGFQYGLIDRNMRGKTFSKMEEHLPNLVASLNHNGEAWLPLGSESLRISLRPGKDPRSGDFNIFEIASAKKKNRRKLCCFLGYRFIAAISNSLRPNLRYCLEPLNIELVWSGIDMNAVGFFDDILKKIKSSDFCIFDNRETRDKPNVYIEAGIAYALKRPFIFAAHTGSKTQFPSDLQHIQCVEYSDYNALVRRLYFILPVFLKETKLRRF
jgi:hypothetical protein